MFLEIEEAMFPNPVREVSIEGIKPKTPNIYSALGSRCPSTALVPEVRVK